MYILELAGLSSLNILKYVNMNISKTNYPEYNLKHTHTTKQISKYANIIRIQIFSIREKKHITRSKK